MGLPFVNDIDGLDDLLVNAINKSIIDIIGNIVAVVSKEIELTAAVIQIKGAVEFGFALIGQTDIKIPVKAQLCVLM